MLGRAQRLARSTNLDVNFIQKHLDKHLTEYLGTPWPSHVDA